MKRICIAVLLFFAVAYVIFLRSGRAAVDVVESASPVTVTEAVNDDGVMTMAGVIDRAKQIRRAMEESLDDYTATFIKQERKEDGTLSPETVIDMKVQTRLRGDDNASPMRVFMRFQKPDAQSGRKVIWGEDLYDGKMAVHEVGIFLGLKTIWLDPNGMIAMQGQRYPISEVGIVKLIEKLIERAADDIDTQGMRISIKQGHSFSGHDTELLVVTRAEPSGREDDFARAEVILDPKRNLILQYRSFGWAENDGEDLPLLESYTYDKVETNVGLTDLDFDVKNPDYGYPAF